ncbi:hypothetical protein J4573_02385 [Actinomadura barringtoniae]|uniref:PhlD n=1 Tax=Actinomadura barringtoniae TaxID=1427535 RepID=A0A939T4H7_9ACTN|nr:hypothetical protein [Actinomadura barringtoniae]MBO2445927.1 hypothetical protein [Actinomadura barringtoniae]
MSTSAYVAKPVVLHPVHRVTTEEILANIELHTREDGKTHSRFSDWERAIRKTGVAERAFTHPLDSPEISGRTGTTARNDACWAAVQDLAENAARQALDAAGLQPADIDALVTSHTTSMAIPQLDVSLINRLGLRPDVRALAMTTLGCVGGAKALGRAADEVRAYPGSRVLVVVAEAISITYHHTDVGIESQIYKGLFGDGAGACVVTSEPVGAGFAMQESHQHLLPHTAQNGYYWGRFDADGFHFRSTRAAVKGPARVMPRLLEWLKAHDWITPDWLVVHAGGPAILSAIEDGLSVPREQLRHSYDSLREVANLGGVSVLDVLRRTHASPPEPGARGLAVAFGPGFTYFAVIGTWTA